MRAELVAVGTELLLGATVDTNSAWLAGRLCELGIACYRHTTVGDNPDRIATAISEASSRAEAVVVCGGLGPTGDDVTRHGLARALGVELRRDASMARLIGDLFDSWGRPMPVANLVQAELPAGSVPIEPARGTAPGIVAEDPAGAGGPTVVYCLPGPPGELTEMFDRAVAPDLVRRRSEPSVILSRVLRTWGLGESAVAELVADRVDAQSNPTIAFLASPADGVRLRLTASAPSDEQATTMLDAEEQALRSRLGDLVYGTDDTTMAQVIAGLALDRQLSIGVAESLTGGMVASMLTDGVGASKWFRGCVVSYASEVKFAVLGVAEGPVVTAEAAAEMACGARRVLGADVGLAATGVAGPEPQDGAEVGTVIMAVSGPGPLDAAAIVGRSRFHGDRTRIRGQAAMGTLDLARRVLSGLPPAR